jgi:hypothetical protein
MKSSQTPNNERNMTVVVAEGVGSQALVGVAHFKLVAISVVTLTQTLGRTGPRLQSLRLPRKQLRHLQELNDMQDLPKQAPVQARGSRIVPKHDRKRMRRGRI